MRADLLCFKSLLSFVLKVWRDFLRLYKATSWLNGQSGNYVYILHNGLKNILLKKSSSTHGDFVPQKQKSNICITEIKYL